VKFLEMGMSPKCTRRSKDQVQGCQWGGWHQYIATAEYNSGTLLNQKWIRWNRIETDANQRPKGRSRVGVGWEELRLLGEAAQTALAVVQIRINW
jgi:hypothetical protein